MPKKKARDVRIECVIVPEGCEPAVGQREGVGYDVVVPERVEGGPGQCILNHPRV